MPVSSGGILKPFADESVRLLREDWSPPRGTKMLSEEVFAILQGGVPAVQGGTTIQVGYGPGDRTGITLEQFNQGDFLSFNDQYGNQVFKIDQFGTVYTAGDINFLGTKPIPGQPGAYQLKRPSDPQFARQRPVIIWEEPAAISEGTPLSGTQLNAVAQDAESGRALEGDYYYDPPAATVLSAGNDQPLYVLFEPRDQNLYRRVEGSTQIDVTAAGLTLVAHFSQAASGAGLRSRNFSVEAGQLILVILRIQDTGTLGIAFGTVTDTDGNVYTQIDSTVRSLHTSGTRETTIAAFWAVADNTGTFTQNFTPSASCDTNHSINIISGADAVSPIGATSTNFEDEIHTNPASTGSVAAGSGDGIFAAFHSTNGTNSIVTAGFSSVGTNAENFYDFSVAGAVDVEANSNVSLQGFVAIGFVLVPA